MTELDRHFVVQIGSPQGGRILESVSGSPSTAAELEEAGGLPQRLRQQMAQRGQHAEGDSASQPRGRQLDTHDIRNLLLDNLEHPRWEEVAQRCLACANCTMVCPTCFCSSVEEVTDLTGDHVRRERSW
ncbi:MAG: hypothetical protein GTO04_05905, partial [Planctomycetales bacterium]|nr:hypothetical protein [Planctomycetales bacterium]